MKGDCTSWQPPVWTRHYTATWIVLAAAYRQRRTHPIHHVSGRRHIQPLERAVPAASLFCDTAGAVTSTCVCARVPVVALFLARAISSTLRDMRSR
eukprot:365289-Chlamydomonas_euryale.AAC.8